MRIYKCSFYDKDEGECLSWHGSRRDAERALHEQQRQRREDAAEDPDDSTDGEPMGPEGVHAIDIPPGKAGLLEWLNAAFTRDNG